MYALSLFRGMRDTQPQRVTLDEVVTMMRTDQSVRDLTDKHRYARSTGDEQGARHYKQMMTNFGVAARFEGGRRQQHIVALTGLSLVDIDHIPPERMGEVLALVHGDPHTLLAYITLSGHGLRIIFRYKINDNVNDDDNCYPLRTTCSSPLKRDSAESAEYKTNQKELSPFKGRSEAFRGLPKWQAVPSEGSAAPCATEADRERNEVNTECSGGGIITKEQYRQVFLQGNAHYEALTGLPADGQCKNIGRVSAIAYAPDLYYNPGAVPFTLAPEEKRPAARPRKGKSRDGEVRVDCCAAAALRELERRGVVYGPGSHNKYISDACYLMNRYGVPEEDCTAWALKSFADYAATDDVPAIVRSCYRQTDEHGTRRPPAAKKRGENTTASTDDIHRWLDTQGISTRYNTMTRKYEVAHGHEAPFTELTDRIVNTYYCDIVQALGKRVFKGDLTAVIESNRSPEYNPMVHYLDSLPPWDGTSDPIGDLAAMVTVSDGAARLHARFFKKWMVGMVAAWLEPKGTNHVILTYIGRQGIYKSTFMRRLLPPVLADYFAVRNFTQLMNTDDRLLLTEKALIALEEIDTLTPAQVSQLNALVTTVTISERAAYARHRENRPHVASFCATGNNPHFITDVYGTRRWAPFHVTDIRSPYDTEIPYDQVYAQAYALYREGFAYWFTNREIDELEQHNRRFEEVSHEEELILTYLRVPCPGEESEFVTSTRIIELVGQYMRVRLNVRKINRAMERLGFERRKTNRSRGWNVIFLTGDDIKRNQRLDARESEADRHD